MADHSSRLEPGDETVVQAIIAVAPETETDIRTLDRGADVFERLGLDSIDHLGVITELETRTGIEIPAREYGQLRSIAALAERVSS